MISRRFRLMLTALVALAAFVIIAGVVALGSLVLDDLEQDRRVEQALVDDANAAREEAIAAKLQSESNKRLIEDLDAALRRSGSSTGDAILAVVNDQRRVHGCREIKTLADIGRAPDCTGRPTRAAVTTTTTAPAPRPTTPPSTTTTTTTTTTTIPPPPPRPTCKGLDVLGVCIGG